MGNHIQESDGDSRSHRSAGTPLRGYRIEPGKLSYVAGSEKSKIVKESNDEQDPVNWERFLLEAVAELGEGFLLKVLTKLKWLRNHQAGEANHKPGRIKMMSKPKMYTISAVTHLFGGRKCTPLVRLTGSWLKEYGFQIGGKILVHATKDQLIIRTGSAMDEALGITGGGSNND